MGLRLLRRARRVQSLNGWVTMRYREHSSALFAVVLAVLLSGCSEQDSRLSLGLVQPMLDDAAPTVSITLRDDGAITKVLLGPGSPRWGPMSTSRDGRLDISFVVLKDGVPTETEGRIELDVREDWGWNIDFMIRSDNPAESCFGCFGNKTFPLDPTLGYEMDRHLYVIWGGNSISDPVVY